MNLNDVAAIALLFIAVTDTFLAQTLLPRMLDESPNSTPEMRKLILRGVNAATVIFFAMALFFYIVRPL